MERQMVWNAAQLLDQWRSPKTGSTPKLSKSLNHFSIETHGDDCGSSMFKKPNGA